MLKLTTDIHEASRGFFATAELLAIYGSYFLSRSQICPRKKHVPHAITYCNISPAMRVANSDETRRSLMRV